MSKTRIKLIGKNESGSTFELHTRPSSESLIGYRKKGSVFGNHWHEGKSKSKNPEVLVLITGKASVVLEHIDTNEQQILTLSAPDSLEIEPFWKHTFTALSDVSFLELNSLEEHKADTIYPAS